MNSQSNETSTRSSPLVRPYFPTRSELELIVRPVYDQSAPIEGKSSNPFGLPSNLEEQRESWRALIPCYKNSTEVNAEIFTVSGLSDAKRSYLARSAAHDDTHLRHFYNARRTSVRVAQCLALILITEHGEGSRRQNQLDYNWALCRELFGADFTHQYREFLRNLQPHPDGYHDAWSLEYLSMASMKMYARVAGRGACPVGCKVVYHKADAAEGL